MAGSGNPGSYITIDRQWAEGDKLTFTLPAAMRVTPYKGADQVAGKTRYAIEYGPVLMAVVGAGLVELALEKGSDPESLGHHLDSIAGAPLHYTLRENPARKLMPYFHILDESFTCYPVISVVGVNRIHDEQRLNSAEAWSFLRCAARCCPAG